MASHTPRPVRFGTMATIASLLAVLLASPAAAFSPVGQAHQVLRRLRQAVAPTPAEQVVAFARTAAETSVTNAEALVAAVQSGDLAAAKAAYLKLRPEYEQIEHLYELFPNSDRDIDSRPDAHQYGEAYIKGLEGTPGAIYKGSHRIEALLYRNGDVASALPWAQQLVTDYKSLVAKLGVDQAARFTPSCIWYGLVEVATEVAKKKISGEEETWSDQSVLIFDTNLEGIDKMYQPWVEALNAADASVAQAVDAAIAAARTVLEPYIEAAPEGGRTYAPYSSVPVPTRRQIQLAFYNVADALTQAAGVLGISVECEPPAEGAVGASSAPPSAEGEAEGEAEAEAEAEAGRRRLTQAEAEAEAGEAEAEGAGGGSSECTPSVTPKVYAGDSPEVLQGLSYFQALIPYQLAASRAFTAAVESGNLTAAQVAYTATRPLYEQIEVLAGSFLALDLALDAREYIFAEGERSPDFTGFHRLERLIFGDGDVGAGTLEVARGVEQTLSVLQVQLNTTAPDRFTSASNFEGMLNLAHEVAAKKVSSEEETFSDLSLMIFYNNWKGILSQAIPYCDDAPTECEAFAAAVQNATECLGIDTEDEVLAVDAVDVTEEFAMHLLDADYGSYAAAPVEVRRCVVERGYAVRDALAAYATALNVLDDCSPWHFASHVPFPYRAEA